MFFLSLKGRFGTNFPFLFICLTSLMEFEIRAEHTQKSRMCRRILGSEMIVYSENCCHESSQLYVAK